MDKKAFIELAEKNGLEVKEGRQGFSIDLKGVTHSFDSAYLTIYGLNSSDEMWMSKWLRDTAETCKRYQANTRIQDLEK